MKNPRVSCVMAVYNGERFVRQALESIVRQTFTDFEFVIINDGSQDRTAEILQEYERREKRIRLLRNAENVGLTKSLNKGILASRGEYIARMDADDVSQPERFMLQVKFLDAHQDYGLVGTWYTKVDEQGRKLWEGRVPPKDGELRSLLIRKNPIPHSSWMVRRDAFRQIGLYDESWKDSQDYEFLFRISREWKIGVVPRFLLFSRISRSSLTNTRARAQTLSALRARINAIRSGQYPKTAYVFCLLALSSFLVPISFRNLLKRLVAYA